jgi:carbamate kinase
MKVLVALGGNAIKQAHEKGTFEEQLENCRIASKALVRIIKNFKAGDWMVITHGNGPQSGNLDVQQVAGKEKVPAQPLDCIVAMTQGQIGYMFQNTLQQQLKAAGIKKDVAAVVNQVEVSPDDPEFSGDNASKPVGNFFGEAEAKELKAKHPDYVVKNVKPTADKGWRRCVPSPIPSANVEANVLKKMLASDIVVIASGGGGVPVMKDANGDYKGLEAVIDKDRAGEVMAVELGADTFMVLTDVENAIVNFGKPEAKPIGAISGADMKKFQAEGHFLAGSMGPKVEACQQFIVDGGARAIITSLDKAEDAIEGKTGTIITK